MNSQRHCPICERQNPDDAPLGLCPMCLIQAALDLHPIALDDVSLETLRDRDWPQESPPASGGVADFEAIKTESFEPLGSTIASGFAVKADVGTPLLPGARTSASEADRTCQDLGGPPAQRVGSDSAATIAGFETTHNRGALGGVSEQELAETLRSFFHDTEASSGGSRDASQNRSVASSEQATIGPDREGSWPESQQTLFDPIGGETTLGPDSAEAAGRADSSLARVASSFGPDTEPALPGRALTTSMLDTQAGESAERTIRDTSDVGFGQTLAATDPGVRPGGLATVPATGDARALAETIVTLAGHSASGGAGRPGNTPVATMLATIADQAPTAQDRRGEGWRSDRQRSYFPEVRGYELLEELGKGGMGVVYKARHVELDRLVALKMIRSSGGVDSEVLERFRVEARAVARLRHPNVVQIYDVGEEAGCPYFSMELLGGGSLGDRLKKHPLSYRDAAALLSVLAEAVNAAHRVGIVHRDLKPANVMFDAEGPPKLTDFGLAKRLEEEGQTIDGRIMGTPNYMAPEQARGENHVVGTPADVYALGAILYEMLTRRPPFLGKATHVLYEVVFADVVAPSKLEAKVPRDLETICLKCLAKEPARRYATAGELAEDLQRYLSGRLVLARRTPALVRAAKWARRRPVAALLTGFTVIALLTTGVGWFRSERDAQARAAAEETRVARKRSEAVDDLVKSGDQLEHGDLEAARLTLTTLKNHLESEPQLGSYLTLAHRKFDEIDRRLADEAHLLSFRRHRDDALFRDSQQSALGLGDRQEQTRTLARTALAVFKPIGKSEIDAPGPLPGTFSAAVQNEIKEGCYQLLMILSDAVSRPLPGEDPRRQSDEAIQILDRAVGLHPATPAYHLRRSVCLDRVGDDAAARTERGLAEKAKPIVAFDYLLMGQELSRRSDWDAARVQFDEALRHPPDNFWAHCLLAIADLNSSPPRAAEARVELSACLVQAPQYPWLYLLRGTANARLGDLFATGSAGYRKSAAESTARYDDAEADFAQALKLDLDKDFHYALLMDRGVERFKRGRYEDASRDFEHAIALAPSQFNAYINLAQTLRKQGERDAAIEQLSRAIAKNPAEGQLYRERASARLDKKPLPAAEIELALSDLDRAASLQLGNPRAIAEIQGARGELLLRLERADEALAAADSALAYDRDANEAQLVRAFALLVLERYDELSRACDEAVAKGARLPELHWLGGVGRFKRKDFAGAVVEYTRALDLRPDVAKYYRDRGWAYLAVSPRRSLSDFDEAARLAPDDRDCYSGRGLAHVSLGKLQEAIADAEASIRGSEPSHRLLLNAARIFAEISSRATTDAARGGYLTSRDSLAYETRAAALLKQALLRLPSSAREKAWRDDINTDPMFRTVLRNPLIVRQLRQAVVSSR